MEQVRLDTIFEWGGGASTIGPIPRNLNKRVLTSLSQSFTHRDNPHGSSFQRDLDELLEADAEYSDNPSLSRLCSIVAELAFRWEKLERQGRRMSGSSSSRPSTDKGKHSSSDRVTTQALDKDDLRCEGCHRTGHTRETCNFRKHPDFNHSGRWEGCKAVRELRVRFDRDRDVKLSWKQRADGTRLTTGTSAAPDPPHHNDAPTPALQSAGDRDHS